MLPLQQSNSLPIDHGNHSGRVQDTTVTYISIHIMDRRFTIRLFLIVSLVHIAIGSSFLEHFSQAMVASSFHRVELRCFHLQAFIPLSICVDSLPWFEGGIRFVVAKSHWRWEYKSNHTETHTQQRRIPPRWFAFPCFAVLWREERNWCESWGVAHMKIPVTWTGNHQPMREGSNICRHDRLACWSWSWTPRTHTKPKLRKQETGNEWRGLTRAKGQTESSRAQHGPSRDFGSME